MDAAEWSAFRSRLHEWSYMMARRFVVDLRRYPLRDFLTEDETACFLAVKAAADDFGRVFQSGMTHQEFIATHDARLLRVRKDRDASTAAPEGSGTQAD